MAKTQWLLLTDYASKYRISVSTLRRRIKNGQQVHRFESGRYYLPDEQAWQNDFRAARANESARQEGAEPVNPQLRQSALSDHDPDHESEPAVVQPTQSDEPLITTTSRLLNELKQAYTLILQEKEEQILHLKEEIADLKTLVRVLESDNARLRPLRNERPIGNA